MKTLLFQVLTGTLSAIIVVLFLVISSMLDVLVRVEADRQSVVDKHTEIAIELQICRLYVGRDHRAPPPLPIKTKHQE